MCKNNKVTIFKLYKNKVGGTEKCVHSLENLINDKYHVEVVSAVDCKEKSPIKDNSHLLIRRNEVKVIKINHFVYFLKLFQFVMDCRSSIIISTDICTSVFLIIIKFLLFKKVKLICWEHVPYKKNSLIFRALSRFFYLFSDKIIVLSEQEKNTYPEHLKNKIKVIYNAVTIADADLFKPKHRYMFPEKIQFISIGRLSPEKGFERIIDACRSYSLKYKKRCVTLNIIGDGPLRKDLEKYVADNPVINMEVIFHGTCFDIARNLSENDIYISGAFYECLPTSVIEAQMMGLPVISFENKYGTKEVITNGVNGFLVSNTDEFICSIDILAQREVFSKMTQESIINSKRFLPELALAQWEGLLNRV